MDINYTLKTMTIPTTVAKEASLSNVTDEEIQPSKLANGFFVFALFVVLIGNLLGNPMVLYVVHHKWKNQRQRVTHSLMANLACIDLSLSILILSGLVRAISFKSGVSKVNCQLDGFLSTTIGAASILTLAAISIDRYTAIVLKRRLKLREVRIMIACAWIIAIFMGLLPILFWGEYHFTEKSTLCKPENGHFLLLLAIVCFVIPLLTMVFCYVNVFLKVHRHKQVITQTQESCNFKADYKTTKIVITVLATFIVLWTPFTVLYVLSSNSDIDDNIPSGAFKFCGFLTAVHSMCNPIIYFTMTKSFRNTAMNLLRKIFPCLLSSNEETVPTTDSIYCERNSCSAKIVTPLAIRKIIPVQSLPVPEDSKI